MPPSLPAPDDLFDRVAVTVSLRRLGYDPDAALRVRRLDRPRSTVFRIRAKAPGAEPVTLYQKKAIDGSIRRSALSPEDVRNLQQGAADRLGTIGIGVPEILYSDPRSALSVTLAVPGRPLERLLRPWWAAGNQGRLLTLLRTLGEGVRMIEEVGHGAGYEHQDELWTYIDQRLAGSPVLDAERRRFRHVLEGLWDEASRQPGTFSYVHGDLSGSNVLVSGASLGLVDFGWPSRMRSYDLVKLAHRLEFGSMSSWSPTEDYVKALVQGYGPDIRDTAAFRFSDLFQLLNRVGRPGSGKAGERNLRKALGRVTDALR